MTAFCAVFILQVKVGAAEELPDKMSDLNGTNKYENPLENQDYKPVYNSIVFSGRGFGLLNQNEEIRKIADLNESTAVFLVSGAAGKISRVESKSSSDITQLKKNFGQSIANLKLKDIEFEEGLDSDGQIYLEKIEFNSRVGDDTSQNLAKALDVQLVKSYPEVDIKPQVNDSENLKVVAVHSFYNQNLTNLLYPSQKRIEELNAEIEASRTAEQEHYKYMRDVFYKGKLKNQGPKSDKVSQLFGEVKAEAGVLNNNVFDQVVYNRLNNGLVWDVVNGTIGNGNKIQLYPRRWNSDRLSYAQKFDFIDQSGEIKYAVSPSTCLDIDAGRYFNGAIVQTWSCNNASHQKFIAHPDGTIRPLYNQNFCLDAGNGVNQFSVIHLWSCHGGTNQKFYIGENDFDGSRYYMDIAACRNCNYQSLNLFTAGHSFTSIVKNNSVTNTFSFWDKTDNYEINNYGTTNNMKTGNNVIVDYYSSGVGDFGTAYYGYTPYNFRYRRIEITKQTYDEIKFMRGYLNNYDNQSYFFTTRNCANYSADLWNKYVEPDITNYFLSGIPDPRLIYDQI
ncbi:MAG: hypothetical protein OHK0017_11800 [Patescibacteria group bacterium]